jgi:hypothetical protein
VYMNNTCIVSPFTVQEYQNRPYTYYLAIDSRYRDKNRYPTPNYFAYDLNNTLKNVMSIELVYAIYDKIGTEKYVNLQINDLCDSNHLSNASGMESAFTQLPLLNYTNEYTSNQFKSIHVFNPPIAKLSRMTFNLFTASGQQYQGRDFFMRFEIVCAKPFT